MNNLFSKKCVLAIFSASAIISMQSCVNEEYDLSQGVDMDIQLLQNASLPIGDVAELQINTLLGDAASGSSLFTTDKNGNLSLSFGHDVLSKTFQMPEVNISGDGGLSAQNKRVDFKLKPKYSEISGTELKKVLKRDDGVDVIYYTESGDIFKPVGTGLNLNLKTEMDKELPKQVLSARTIELDADLNFTFKVSDDAIMNLEEGLEIIFPNYMVLADAPEGAYYKVVENNKVVFINDVNLHHSEPITLNLNLIRFIDVEGMLQEKEGKDGELRRFLCNNDDIEVYGNIYMDPNDYGALIVPKNPYIMLELDLDNLVMTKAEVIIDMDLKIDDKNVEIGEMPEMFTGDGTVVDLYNPTLRFQLNNNSPLALEMNAELSSFTSNKSTDIHIGSNCKYGNPETESILIPADGKVEYYFSRQGKHDTESGKDITLEKLGDIITEIPENLVIHDIEVSAEREYIWVEAAQEFTVNLDYEFFSPMSFGKDLNISFGYDISLALDDLALDLDSLMISMNIVNSIPLEFNIKGVAVDSNGKEVNGASVDLDMNIHAGTTENPVETPVEIVLSTNNSKVNISTLRLMFTATTTESMQGQVLNSAHGLAINDLHLTLPQGIVLDLGNNDSNDNYDK